MSLETDKAIDEAIARPREDEPSHHAAISVTEDKTATVEVGGTTEKLSWSAYAKKVWKGPWTTGATFKW